MVKSFYAKAVAHRVFKSMIKLMEIFLVPIESGLNSH